jgi:hypothetical protein
MPNPTTPEENSLWLDPDSNGGEILRSQKINDINGLNFGIHLEQMIDVLNGSRNRRNIIGFQFIFFCRIPIERSLIDQLCCFFRENLGSLFCNFDGGETPEPDGLYYCDFSGYFPPPDIH